MQTDFGNKAIATHQDEPSIANAVGQQAFATNDLSRASWATNIGADAARKRLASDTDPEDAADDKKQLLNALNIHAAVADHNQDWPTAKRDTDEIISLHPDDPKILEAAQAINAMAVSHIGRVDPRLGKLNTSPFGDSITATAGPSAKAFGAPPPMSGVTGGTAGPSSAEVKDLLENAQTKLGINDPEAALKAATKASSLDGTNAQAKLLAAIALLSLSRLQQALDAVDKAISLKEGQGPAANSAPPERSWLAAAYTTRGRTEEAMGQWPAARGDYKHAVELDPQGQAQAATVFLQRLDAQLGGGQGAKAPAGQLAEGAAAGRGRGWLLGLAALALLAGAAGVTMRDKLRAFWGAGAGTTAGGGRGGRSHSILDDTPATTGRLAAGITLGHYELRKPLGRGGMGEVWEAFDHSLNRLVAIKKLASGRGDDPKAVDMLVDEALNVAKLKHPNITAIHFVFRGQQTGDVYLVFEHLSEGTVLDKLEDGPLPPDQAARIARGVAEALDYAHAQGVIHRDLKPSNILLERGAPKVADFGIARLTEHSEGTVTESNAGTPLYMAPEQSMGVVSRQTDFYALGVTAYQMLTGVLPFPASKPELKLSGEFMPPTQRVPTLPRAVDAFFARALNPDPKLRFKDGAEFASELERAVESVTPLPRAA